MSVPGRIVELRVATRPEAWAAAGFAVEDGSTRIGATRIRFEPDAEVTRGAILGWSLAGVAGDDFHGLETTLLDAEAVAAADARSAPEHPNSALSIDHVVAFSPELERTVAAFERSGVRCRRLREPDREDAGPGPDLRQAFFRLGETLAEVVEVEPDRAAPGGRARFWGLTAVLSDLDRAVAELGERVGSISEAVQPGRRIATIRREAGLGLPVALITPGPARD